MVQIGDINGFFPKKLGAQELFVRPVIINEIFSSTIMLTYKTKSREKVSSLEVVEVVLAQCNFVDNQYQRKSEALYTFTHNKSYAYFLNVGLSISVFLKTYNTEFDGIIITFTDQNCRLLEIEDKVNLTLIINK